MSYDIIADFMAIAGITDEEVAIRLMDQASYDLSVAVALYDSEQRGGNTEASSQGAPASPVSSAASPGPVITPFTTEPLLGGGGGTNGHAGGHTMHDTLATFPADPFTHVDASAWQQATFEVDDEGNGGVLAELYEPPTYVNRGTMPFSTFCQRAESKDRWVLLSVLGDDLKSMAVNRDLWKSEVAQGLLEGVADVYQVTKGHPSVSTFIESYRLRNSDIPALLVIDPITEVKDYVVSLTFVDAALQTEVVLASLHDLLVARGSPRTESEKRMKELLENRDKAIRDQTTKSSQHGSPTLPRPADGEDGTMSKPVIVDEDDTPGNATAATIEDTPKMIPVVTLEEYITEPSPDAFVLRCRLPKETVTLHLKKETPVQKLILYLAYLAYSENGSPTSAAPQGQLPHCALKAGFPPRTFEPENDTVTIGDWGKFKSGETVILHIL